MDCEADCVLVVVVIVGGICGEDCWLVRWCFCLLVMTMVVGWLQQWASGVVTMITGWLSLMMLFDCKLDRGRHLWLFETTSSPGYDVKEL